MADNTCIFDVSNNQRILCREDTFWSDLGPRRRHSYVVPQQGHDNNLLPSAIKTMMDKPKYNRTREA